MSNYLFLIMIFILYTNGIYSQKYDTKWLMGYSNPDEPIIEGDVYGISIIDFKDDSLSIYEDVSIRMNFTGNALTMSDFDGEMLFYTNVVNIENYAGQIIENGTDLQNKEFRYGFSVPQSALALPTPEQENRFTLFHNTRGWVDLPDYGLEVLELFYSIIDMDENDGLGKVILRKEPLLLDTLQYGKLTATKHANGRDWWLLVNESHTNRFYTILLDPNGVAIVDNQAVGQNEVEGLGQAVFLPDGTRYVTLNMISNQVGSFLQIFDFDRCTGTLSNPQQLYFNEVVQSGGVAISPNSRFLYLSFYNNIYQYDLQAEDVAASQVNVARYGGFESPFPTRFYLAQLAPDGKIYINAPNGVNVLHVIHNPDEKGRACNVEQHGIQLPTYNAFSMPNHPNYRLGALKDSPCDSLTTSITEAVFSDKINIYPNPVKDVITIESEQLKEATFYLTDALGRQVLKQEIMENQQQITVDFLAEGVYFYSVRNDDNGVLKSGKLVVQ